MLFTAFPFLFAFFPISVGAYLLLRRVASVGASLLWLSAASLVFYVDGEKTYPWLLPVSVLANFGFGLAIARSEGGRRRAMAAAGIAANLLALGFFKYVNFLQDQLVALHLLDARALTVVLPVGISFFTFTQIAFLVDSYQHKTAERRFVPYFLFVTFYPHLIAGPILHHKEMIGQFVAERRPAILANLHAGLIMFAIGLAKKVLLADPAGQVATPIFEAASAGGVGFLTAWIGALAYTLQIYFDFSGYSDMALGISRCMGIELPINFNSPYKSTSIVEFWRRWHITLSRFLRDYLYIPLGGSRRGPARRYLNLAVTMLLGGLWHGAGWTFLLWGALHGGALALNHACRDRLGRTLRVPAALGWTATILFVMVAWVPFRASGLEATLALWKAMAGLDGFALPALGPLRAVAERLGLGTQAVSFSSATLVLLALGLAVAVFAPNSQELTRRFRIGLDSPGYGALGRADAPALRLGWRSAIAAGFLLGIAARSVGGYTEFIYFQF